MYKEFLKCRQKKTSVTVNEIQMSSFKNPTQENPLHSGWNDLFWELNLVVCGGRERFFSLKVPLISKRVKQHFSCCSISKYESFVFHFTLTYGIYFRYALITFWTTLYVLNMLWVEINSPGRDYLDHAKKFMCGNFGYFRTCWSHLIQPSVSINALSDAVRKKRLSWQRVRLADRWDFHFCHPTPKRCKKEQLFFFFFPLLFDL